MLQLRRFNTTPQLIMGPRQASLATGSCVLECRLGGKNPIPSVALHRLSHSSSGGTQDARLGRYAIPGATETSTALYIYSSELIIARYHSVHFLSFFGKAKLITP